ncbi:4-amino-4-deoxy-L-arabinose transferase [Aquimonas voraii]|uniref:4-amino-4-deoxy-L-arabinose transferase n=2 Tax=Aquimonas voraii TaxID=265719 RepID=A0A1G6UZ46_9GAMM|nr:4-amino-4-deoxy-L-arabinose transferase [Aquimonas voraii]
MLPKDLRQAMPNTLESASWLRALLVVALFLALSWVLAWYVGVASVASPDFDGALNFKVSASVIEGHGYGSYYERFALFPIETQTNGPLVLPAAASIWLFGLTPIGLQLVNLLYVLALCALVFACHRRAAESRDWVVPMLGAVCCLQVPGMAQYALFGYGEVAAVVWGLAALWVLSCSLSTTTPPRLLGAGVLLGLSFLTKTVSLIWFPSIAGIYCLLIWRRASLWAAIRSGLWIGLGVLIALMVWEVYRAISLGSAGTYIEWWSEQFSEIRKQAGVRDHYADTPTWQAKLALHGAALAGFLKLPLWGLVLAGAAFGALLSVALWRSRGDDVRLYLLAALGSVALLYLYWWLLITPTEMMWLRRIMLGLLFVLLSLLVAVSCLWRAGPAGRVAALSGLGLVFVIVLPGQLLWGRPDRAVSAGHDFDFAAAVRALPEDALIFGSGWWQAPVAALLSQRQIQNEEAWSVERLAQAGRDAYLVLDRDALNLGKHTLQRLTWRCDCEPVHLSPGGRIYRVRALFDSPETSEASAYRLGPDSSVFGQGFSTGDEGGFRWAEQEARMQLPEPVHSDRWVLSLAVPDSGYLRTPAGMGITIEVEMGTCGVTTITVPPGEQHVLLRPACDQAIQSFVFRTSDHIDPERIRPDVRKLAFAFRSLEAFPTRTDRPVEQAAQP